MGLSTGAVGGLPSVGAVVLSTGAAGDCRLLVLWFYLLVLRGIAVCWCCDSIYWCCGGLPSVGAVVLSTGAAGDCRLLVLWFYLLVLRGIAVCWCCGSIYWCCGGLPSVGAVCLFTGAAGDCRLLVLWFYLLALWGCQLLMLWVSGQTGCISLLLVLCDCLSIATSLLVVQE